MTYWLYFKKDIQRKRAEQSFQPKGLHSSTTPMISTVETHCANCGSGYRGQFPSYSAMWRVKWQTVWGQMQGGVLGRGGHWEVLPSSLHGAHQVIQEGLGSLSLLPVPSGGLALQHPTGWRNSKEACRFIPDKDRHSLTTYHGQVRTE